MSIEQSRSNSDPKFSGPVRGESETDVHPPAYHEKFVELPDEYKVLGKQGVAEARNILKESTPPQPKINNNPPLG